MSTTLQSKILDKLHSPACGYVCAMRELLELGKAKAVEEAVAIKLVLPSSRMTCTVADNNDNIYYSPTPNTYLTVSVKGTVTFVVEKEVGDAPNAAIRLAAQSDNTIIYDSMNKFFNEDTTSMTIVYEFTALFSYRGDGMAGKSHWFRFGVAIEKGLGNFTSSKLSEKKSFNLISTSDGNDSQAE